MEPFVSPEAIGSMSVEELQKAVTSTVEPSSADRDSTLAKLEIATLSVIFLLIVLGNSAVMLALIASRIKMQRMYYFLLHLSVSDLITAFFNVLPQLIWEITVTFQGGNLLCKFVKYIQLLGPYLSSYVLVMTAIDRYQAICHPLANCSWTSRRGKLMIAGAWTISLICCTPQLFIFSYIKVTIATPTINSETKNSSTLLEMLDSTASPIVYYECWGTFIQPWGEKLYVLWYAVSVFFVPLSVLTFTYLNITKVIWINARRNRRAAAARREATIESARRSNFSKTISTTKVVQQRAAFFVRRFQGTSVRLSTSASMATQRSEAGVESINSNHKRICHFLLCGCCRSSSSFQTAAKKSSVCTQQDLPTSPFGRSFTEQGHLPPPPSSPLPNTEIQKQSDFEHQSKQLQTNGSIREIDNNSLASTIAAGTTIESPATPTIKLFSGSRSTLNSVRLIDSPHARNGRNVSITCNAGQSKSETITPQNTSNSATETLTPRSSADPTKLTKAKIKTIKITIVVIICYISCSLPFVLVQLWAHWYPGAQTSSLWTGPLITITMLLPNLNSCVNPWIYLAFNRNLWYTLLRLLLGVKTRSSSKHRNQHSCTNQGEFNSSIGYSEHSQNIAVNVSSAPTGSGAHFNTATTTGSSALRVRGPRSTGNVNSIVTTARSPRPLLRDAFRRETNSASESRSSECSCNGRELSTGGGPCCHVEYNSSRIESNNNSPIIKKKDSLNSKIIEISLKSEDKQQMHLKSFNPQQEQQPHQQLQRSSSYAKQANQASFYLNEISESGFNKKRRASK